MNNCELLVISCIDYRFQEPLREFLNQSFKGNFDLVCLAGSARVLCSANQNEKDLLLNQVKLAHSLHEIKRVFLINHQNCGAYGPELSHGTPKEKEKHSDDLRLAKDIVSQHFPNLEVQTYFTEFDREPIKNPRFTEIV